MSKTDTIIVFTGYSPYNIMGYAARQAVSSWQDAGYKVLVVDFEDMAWSSQLQMALNADPRFVFTFDPQLLDAGMVPGKGLCELFEAPIITHLSHHPARHLDVLLPPRSRLIVVAADQGHREFLKRLYFHAPGGVVPVFSGFFPHPGYPPPSEGPGLPEEYRPIQVLFAGSLDDPRKFRERWHMHLPEMPAALMDQIAEYCVKNDNVVLDQILEMSYRRINDDLLEDPDNLGFCYKALEGYVRNFRRMVCLQTMIEAGLPLLVHCNNPDLLEVPAGFPAEVRPPLEFSGMLELFQQAKMVLSIMPDMSGGMSELVAAAMFNGALIVSENQAWLRREFRADRRAVYFPSPAPEKAVAAVAWALRRERRRAAIAAAGRDLVRMRYDMRCFTSYIERLADAWYAGQSRNGA